MQGLPQNLTMKAHKQNLYKKYAHQAKIYFDNTGKHQKAFNGTLLHERAKRAKGNSNLIKDRAWSGEVSVGTPAKKTLVVFDTGSADIVLHKDSYNPSKSKTAKDLHKKFNFQYVFDEVNGELYSDKIAIGGVKASNVAIGHGAENFDGDVTGGTFGLSFPPLSAYEVDSPNFPQAVKEQHPSQKNTYQFTMRSNGDSSMHVGEIVKSEIKGDFTWVDASGDDMYWKADIKINGKKTRGIVDTGTTVVAGPNNELKDVLESISGVNVVKDDDGNYQGKYDCNNPPKVEFEISGKKFKLGADAMMIARDNDECTLGLTGLDGWTDWIYGDTFLQSVSVVFDFNEKRLGFAKQSN